jgi:hypothetical protein
MKIISELLHIQLDINKSVTKLVKKKWQKLK